MPQYILNIEVTTLTRYITTAVHIYVLYDNREVKLVYCMCVLCVNVCPWWQDNYLKFNTFTSQKADVMLLKAGLEYLWTVTTSAYIYIVTVTVFSFFLIFRIIIFSNPLNMTKFFTLPTITTQTGAYRVIILIYIPQLRPIYPPAHRVLFDNYHVLLSGFQTCNIKVLSLFTTSPIYFKCDNSHVHTFVVLCTSYARTAFCLAFFLEISFPRVLLYFFVYVLSNSFLYWFNQSFISLLYIYIFYLQCI